MGTVSFSTAKQLSNQRRPVEIIADSEVGQWKEKQARVGLGCGVRNNRMSDTVNGIKTAGDI